MTSMARPARRIPCARMYMAFARFPTNAYPPLRSAPGIFSIDSMAAARISALKSLIARIWASDSQGWFHGVLSKLCQTCRGGRRPHNSRSRSFGDRSSTLSARTYCIARANVVVLSFNSPEAYAVAARQMAFLRDSTTRRGAVRGGSPARSAIEVSRKPEGRTEYKARQALRPEHIRYHRTDLIDGRPGEAQLLPDLLQVAANRVESRLNVAVCPFVA